MPRTIEITGTIFVDGVKQVHRLWSTAGVITETEPEQAGESLSGYVYPGLVDMHCHIGVDVNGGTSLAVATEQARQNAATGVLLIRDAGSATDTAALNENPELPELIRAGRFIARTGRYLRNFAVEVAPGELVETVVAQAKAGNGWVKLIADWIDRDQGDITPVWDHAELIDAVAAAHELGVRVTAHTFATESIAALLDANIDCIEHGTGMLVEHMQEAARRGVPVVPTLLQVENFAAFAVQGASKFPRYAERMQHLFDQRYMQIQLFQEHGVQLLPGTDAGGAIGHGRMMAELELWRQAGVEGEQIMAAATWLARSFLARPTLEAGASADFVVYRSDPSQDIAELSRPLAVVRSGIILRREEN